jgi:2-polyprenyl-3-methyl-5-hydroxy-6-metoxy-1,4-benzoquinol methylase
MTSGAIDARARAELSQGTSEAALYTAVAKCLQTNIRQGGLVVDVGCGVGKLATLVGDLGGRYLGVDIVRYREFPSGCEFLEADLNAPTWPLQSGEADAVVSVETIEHLENPRAFVRELTRIAKPGAFIVVTTPNQLSLTSKLCLLIKNEFDHFQERPGLYPAHITALLATDLSRIARECGLLEVQIAYTLHGRIIFTEKHYPAFLSRLFPRACSDNVILLARKPGAVAPQDQKPQARPGTARPTY